MEDEKNTTLTTSEDLKTEKPSANKNDAANKDSKLKTFIKELRGEFSKIIWVSKEELLKQTITVICVSIIVGVIIFGMDSVFKILFDLLVSNFVSKG